MYIHKIAAIVVIALLAVDTSSLCYGESLKEELIKIDSLRNGTKTPLDEVDRRGEQLLNEYPNPKDRGQIHYQLAHIHGQSGMLHPEKVIAHANNALQCPLAPSQEMRIHTYWGDALIVINRKKPLADRRREAVPVYLKGLRRLIDLNLNLPEKPPKPEVMTIFHGPDAEENRRKNEEQWAQRQKIDFQTEMIKHRDVLQGQIVSLYGRRPIANDELKNTATSILGEGKELDRLMTTVNDKIAKLPPEQTPNMTPVEAAVPAASPKYLYLSIALGAGAVLAVGLLLLSRWRRARQKM